MSCLTGNQKNVSEKEVHRPAFRQVISLKLSSHLANTNKFISINLLVLIRIRRRRKLRINCSVGKKKINLSLIFGYNIFTNHIQQSAKPNRNTVKPNFFHCLWDSPAESSVASLFL